jgi:hypothetical protein
VGRQGFDIQKRMTPTNKDFPRGQLNDPKYSTNDQIKTDGSRVTIVILIYIKGQLENKWMKQLNPNDQWPLNFFPEI